jgi:hypothetical protein
MRQIVYIVSAIINHKWLIYKALLYCTLILSSVALVAEILPEVEAKIIVIPTLLLIIIIGIFDLKIKKWS